MKQNYLLLCLFGISVYCLIGIVAREAIVGGNRAAEIEIRYQASILIAGLDRVPRCGGGIIRENFVLTAAHCVVGCNGELIGKPISVLVGTNNLGVPGELVKVVKIVIPKDYNQFSQSDDIAVLKLKKTLDMEKHNLKLLRLPNRRNSHSYTSRIARIAGFGWDKMFADNEIMGVRTDHLLRFIDAEVLSFEQCQYDQPTVNITKKHLCAKAKQYPHVRRGVCVGDDGGPLALHGYVLIGILAEPSLTCSELTTSALYTRVLNYVEFINMAMEGLQTVDMRVYSFL